MKTTSKAGRKVALLCSLLFYFSVLLLTVAFFSAFTYLPLRGEEAVYDSVIRLHVIANSDSENDQNMKLFVRDAVLEKASALFGENVGKISRAEAECILRDSLPVLENTAAAAVAEYGGDYPVCAELTVEKYPEKSYENFCFPGGEYLSLRMKIGASEGQNWWCVLFPPLCLSAATAPVSREEAEDAFIAVGLTEEQYRIITETDDPKYKIRFKILETVEELFD